MFAESRIGRQPNAIKHATFLELTRIKTEKGIGSPSNDLFSLSETKPELTEIGDHDSIVTAVNDQQTDFIVRASPDGQRPAVGQKKPRCRYRRRTKKLNFTGGISNDNPSPPCLSPLEIKQEVTSLVGKYDTNNSTSDEHSATEFVQEFSANYEQEFSNCGEQGCTEMRSPEHNLNQSTIVAHTQNAESEICCVHNSCFTEHLPSDGSPDTADSGFVVPRSNPSLTAVQNFEPVNAASSTSSSSSSQSPQPNYEDIVSSMQQACYDLLPILDRV